MKKAIKKERKICCFCGTKRFIEKMRFCNHKNGNEYACINNDVCVLKMSFNKKSKKICKKN